MNESDIPIMERQMAMRESQTGDRDKDEILNSDTRGSIPFNSSRNHESMDDICGDDREYMELYHKRKQRIKKHKKSNRNKENDADRNRDNIFRDKLPHSNRK